MLLPIFIFLAEMCVVTLGTLRIIFLSRGNKYLAPCLGFFEILIWLFAISQIMQNLNNITCFMAFALGFTSGNLLGILIERKLAMGLLNIRIITHRDGNSLVDGLRKASFGVTSVRGQGSMGPVQIIMTVVPRRAFQSVVNLIEEFDPKAFYAVDELQVASAGIFPMSQRARVIPLTRELQAAKSA